MVQTTRLQLPLIAAAQAQKHVTHNEALLKLDGLAQFAVKSATTTAQPASPADGDIYLLPSGKTGTNWGGAANYAIAHYYDGVWHFLTPQAGWRAFVTDTSRFLYFNGTLWADLVGVPTSVAHAGGNFTANGAMTWTVDAGDQTAFWYALVGKMMTIGFKIAGSSVGGTLNTALQIAIPASKTAALDQWSVGWMYQGTWTACFLFVEASGTVIKVQKADGSNWGSSTNGTYVLGEITFPIS